MSIISEQKTDSLDVNRIRQDFPVLNTLIHKKPLVYLDNGATTQKPRIVIEKLNELYQSKNSSIHRGVHTLSENMTGEYENAREIVRKFINARSSNEIVFTSGATGSINAIAFSFGEKFIKEGDEIIISEMEHHSNIVPWQMLCERKKAKLRIIPFDENGELMQHEFELLFTKKTRLLALTQASNSLGTLNPVKEMIRFAHDHEVPVMIDGAQAIQHGHVDVQDLNCDFYVFSGHKVFGPTGIGVLYGKEAMLDVLPPYQGGGDMVDCVKFEKTTYNILPFKFEAGTSNYTGAIALGTALQYVDSIGIDAIVKYEKSLLSYAEEKLKKIEGLDIYGTAENKISVLSFLIQGLHPYDTGMILDKMGIAVRTGTHCTQPVMDHFKIAGTIRASMVFYNTFEELDRLVEGLVKAKEMLS
ncbi:MAG: cysteine desulfurase [Bacteroidales bacterium]|nr:cysteine desulfurase [Bacteroidales bacterium]MCB9000270.1 cysteine desulfurase [Bacteroidales bacterium]